MFEPYPHLSCPRPVGYNHAFERSDEPSGGKGKGWQGCARCIPTQAEYPVEVPENLSYFDRGV